MYDVEVMLLNRLLFTFLLFAFFLYLMFIEKVKNIYQFLYF
jgi:hypothetical protein